MKTIINQIETPKLADISLFYDINYVLFFDIETTGLSAHNSLLYLIGCIYFKDDSWFSIQWFNEDTLSEAEIISSFFDFMKPYKYLLHYNGDGFDIPFINTKIKQLGLSYSFSKINSVDLYKIIRPFKSLFHIDNIKQKSIEKYLGVGRDDIYSGGDLITVYKSYVMKPNSREEDLLLLHNADDVKGLLSISSLLSFPKLKAEEHNISNISVSDNCLVFHITTKYFFAKRFIATKESIPIMGKDNLITIKIPLVQDELKFFFNNHSEYYYLPDEDIAIHKSVSSYMDKDKRVKCKKDTCYIKKAGIFICQLTADLTTSYKFASKDKISYIEVNDEFFENKQLIHDYVHSLIKNIL